MKKLLSKVLFLTISSTLLFTSCEDDEEKVRHRGCRQDSEFHEDVLLFLRVCLHFAVDDAVVGQRGEGRMSSLQGKNKWRT